jgi:hypothetical protein
MIIRARSRIVIYYSFIVVPPYAYTESAVCVFVL